MRKNIFTILACATTAAMMFGCGSGAKKAAAEAAAEKSRRIPQNLSLRTGAHAGVAIRILFAPHPQNFPLSTFNFPLCHSLKIPSKKENDPP